MDATTLVLIGTGLQFAVSAAPIARRVHHRLRLRLRLGIAPTALVQLAIAAAPLT
jgi:hypothetical protein